MLCAISIATKKSLKIFVILFGGIKKSMYLCRRFSGARQFDSKLSFALACKIFAPSYKTCGTTPQRACDGHTYDGGARDKQIAASVLSYHRQGPLLREGQERTKRGPRERRGRACERRTERQEREEQRGRNRERREKNNFHHL